MSVPYYISTPLYYVNGPPHLGHAYTTIAADATARYRRMTGRDVFFLTGTDEHGQKLERTAQEAGLAPADFVERIVRRFQDLWTTLEISHDDFIRTTERRHHDGVRAILQRMVAAGDVYQGTYEGWYCTGCEAFYPESQLVEGRCPEGHGRTERLEEASYFFRLSRYKTPLLRHYRQNPDFVRPPSRLNEVIAFVEAGLRDLSISRTSVGWGIPYPGDPSHVIYVWLDALSNYITALGYGSPDPARFERYWPADVHLIGKEILRFHAVYWPAFLMSAGIPLPKQVYAHGWLLFDERKMSKSFGNVLDPNAYIEVFGPEAIRYCLLREVAFGSDGSVSDEGFVDRINADLANDLGNLLSRVTKMAADWFDGRMPAPHRGCEASTGLRQAAAASLSAYRTSMDGLEFHRSLQACWELVGAVNRFVDEQEPWRLHREGGREAHLGGVLYDASEAIRWIALMTAPVMPSTARRIFRALGVADDPLEGRLDALAWGGLRPGVNLGPREALFPRLDRDGTMNRIAELRKGDKEMTEHRPDTKAEPEPTGEDKGKEPFPEGGELLDIEQFRRLDLRVGCVKEAEAVEGADKLLVLRVDLGTETRQIVSGIRPDYEAHDMVGKHIIVVTNLKAATIRGVRSDGMLLAASDGDHVILATLDRSVSPGSPVS